jgi:hypothetical protein
LAGICHQQTKTVLFFGAGNYSGSDSSSWVLYWIKVGQDIGHVSRKQNIMLVDFPMFNEDEKTLGCFTTIYY